MIIKLLSQNIIDATPIATQQDFNKKYFELLEKTNQQLSYSFNSTNTQIQIILIIIGLLTLFVGIGAIVTAVILNRRKKEYEKESNKNMQEFNKKAEKYFRLEIRRREQKLKNILQEINKTNSSYKKQLLILQEKKPRSSKEIKELQKKLKKSINRLEQQIDLMKISSNVATDDSTVSLSPGGLILHGKGGYCNNCKRFCLELGNDGLCSECRNWPGIPPAI